MILATPKRQYGRKKLNIVFGLISGKEAKNK
jgi:hypothetical protein